MKTQNALAVELSAVIVAVTGDAPRVLTVRDGAYLPSGPLEPDHRTLELGLRAWVEARTHHPLGYVEQLYTFADRDRAAGGRMISLSYLALTQEARPWGESGAAWSDWYGLFPWEDHRAGPPALLTGEIAPRMLAWAQAGGEAQRERMLRASVAFGLDDQPWNEELALRRYELLYEAGLAPESWRDQGRPPAPDLPSLGRPMALDHRRIVATGISRLRAKLKYRPVVFELMPPAFTLSQLQQVAEAISGRTLHKQNFRRFVEAEGLVEDTGEVLAETGGRPARLVRFRRQVLSEREVAGARLPLARG